MLRLLPLASLLLHAAASSSSNNNNTTCPPVTCGELRIAYPFSLAGPQPVHCGYPAFQLTCDRGRAYLNRTLREHMLRVDEIHYENSSMVMAVEEAAFAGNTSCRFPDFNVSSSLSLLPVNISDTNKNLFFVYGEPGDHCTLARHPSPTWNVSCGSQILEAFVADDRSFVPANMSRNCSFLSVPVRPDGAKAESWPELIAGGFLVEWVTLGDCRACNLRGGECRFNEGSFLCSCPDGLPCPNSNSTTIPSSNSTNIRGSTFGIKVGVGIAAAVLCLTILTISCILVFYRRKRKRSASFDGLIRGDLRKDQFSLAGSPGTHIFTYEELDEATNGFSDARELGVGGFGTVYKGTLRDGSVVAVKRLYKNSYKGREQFQNEVDILSRLRHPNLVTLYGCTSPAGGGCRERERERDLLLVYEFVPNGTLADHLHGARAAGKPPLAWATRLGIAVETASALDYLHAVEPQVVHRDVKTNNILLDEGFHVKVADFGLSRLFPADATHVSTAPQGTPGYVDPTYHQCYQLTDKSDVYSFGVVLAELISSKPAVDMSRAGGDVNLANMAVRMIQSYAIDQLVDARFGYRTTSDGETTTTRRTVDLVAEVAFRCLQPEQGLRPPVSEVLEVLREAQMMEKVKVKVGCAKDDAGLLKKNRDGSPDTVMYQWMSPSTATTTSNHSS